MKKFLPWILVAIPAIVFVIFLPAKFSGAPETNHFRQVIRPAILDYLSRLLVTDEPSVFTPDPNIAVQRHIHAGPDGGPVDHGDRRFADD